jgi:predicted Zn-dependent peptidase
VHLEKLFDETLNETLYSATHSSGLRVYILPKKGYSKVYATFSTKYGSVDNKFVVPGEENETEVPDGIAHFLEHKLFEEEGGNVFDRFMRIGASPNAFTSFNLTSYLFSCTSEFMENFDTLINFVQNPYFTDESVEKEQGIIGQEIRMYEDDPNWRVFFNCLEGLYKHHPVRKDIAGTIESIGSINKEVLFKCYNTFYHPSNMIIFVIGEVNPEEIIERVSKNIKANKMMEKEIKRIYPDEPKEIAKPLVEQNLSVSVPLFQIGFKDSDIGYGGKGLLKKDITTKIILEMLLGKSSSLYQSLYEEGIINDSFEVDYTGEKEYAFSAIGGESANPERVKDEIIKEIKRLDEERLDRETYERIKKVIYSRFVRQFNHIEKLANSFTSNMFKGINLFDYKNVYESITFEDVEERFYLHFKEDNMVLSIVRPY